MQLSCDFKANQQNPHTNTASYKAAAVQVSRWVLWPQFSSCYFWGLRKDTFLQEGSIYVSAFFQGGDGMPLRLCKIHLGNTHEFIDWWVLLNSLFQSASGLPLCIYSNTYVKFSCDFLMWGLFSYLAFW